MSPFMLGIRSRFPRTYSALHAAAKAWRPCLSQPVAYSTSRPNSEPFLMIVGAGRSGNTLFRRLLMERSPLYIPPETYVLGKIADLRLSARGIGWASTVDLMLATLEYHPEFTTFDTANLRDLALEAKGWPEVDRTVNTLLLALYRTLAKNCESDAIYYGDKTPLNTMNLHRIAPFFPDARYVYLLRDGVDVAKSYVDAGIYPDISSAAKRWRDSVRHWESFRVGIGSARYVEIRYEDLVKNPESEIRNVIFHLGLPVRDSVIDVSACLGDVDKLAHHENVARPPFSGSIGKGRVRMTPNEARQVRPILNRFLKRYGYDRV